MGSPVISHRNRTISLAYLVTFFKGWSSDTRPAKINNRAACIQGGKTMKIADACNRNKNGVHVISDRWDIMNRKQHRCEHEKVHG